MILASVFLLLACQVLGASKTLDEHLKEYTMDQANEAIRYHLDNIEPWHPRRWFPFLVGFAVMLLMIAAWFWCYGISDLVKHGIILAVILASGFSIIVILLLLL